MSKFIFWALASHGPGISGGDRIYIEFTKRWSTKYPVRIVSWQEGADMMSRNGLSHRKNISFDLVYIPNWPRSNFFICYISRIIIGIFKSLILKISHPQTTYLYSASEFWMDSLPCWILKLRYPEVRWIATWFQTAPSPIKGFSSGTRSEVYRLNAFLLWASQLPIKPLIAKSADFILVNNDLEKRVYQNSRNIIVLGAVNID